jgi:uncharacterized repeat protein (TIGR03806 family)
MRAGALSATILLAFTLGACDAAESTSPADAGDTRDTLAALEVFTDPVAQTPAPGFVPYDVISVLYADHSEKLRFIRVPEGQKAVYHDAEPWEYPVGTQLVKTFFYPKDARDPSLGRRLLETRIVEREEDGWTMRTYVWNDEQTEAVRERGGARIPITWIDEAGETESLEYRVPNENQCGSCHAQHHVLEPLGPRTRQLNRDHDYGKGPENQIDHFVALGMVGGDIPPPGERQTLADPLGDGPLDARARSYFEGNCAHCHRPGGGGGSTGLDLRLETTNPLDLGVCRVPSAAGPASGGRTYDVVPGDPDASILVYRIESTDPEIKMPELPTGTSDPTGVALVRAWISAMPKGACDAAP